MSALVRIPDSSRTLRHFRNVPRTDIDGTADLSPQDQIRLFDLGAWMAPRPKAEPFEVTRQSRCLRSRHGTPVGAAVVDTPSYEVHAGLARSAFEAVSATNRVPIKKTTVPSPQHPVEGSIGFEWARAP